MNHSFGHIFNRNEKYRSGRCAIFFGAMSSFGFRLIPTRLPLKRNPIKLFQSAASTDQSIKGKEGDGSIKNQFLHKTVNFPIEGCP